MSMNKMSMNNLVTTFEIQQEQETLLKILGSREIELTRMETVEQTQTKKEGR